MCWGAESDSKGPGEVREGQGLTTESCHSLGELCDVEINRFGFCQKHSGCCDESGLNRASAGAGRPVGCCRLGWTWPSKLVKSGWLRDFGGETDKLTGELNVKWEEGEDDRGFWVSSLGDQIVSSQKT